MNIEKNSLLWFVLRINECVDIIKTSTKDIKKDDFIENIILQDCINMRLQIIGELTIKLSKKFPDIVDSTPNFPWKNISGLRNIISHDYFSIKPDISWKICEHHLNDLIVLTNYILNTNPDIHNKYKMIISQNCLQNNIASVDIKDKYEVNDEAEDDTGPCP